jgi:hypothetical protein
MKALIFTRYAKADNLAFTDLPAPRSSRTRCSCASTPSA